ncbi:hypothetical protein RCL1_007707 [Eukaryota sp. TZLM3-RCL]
MNVSSLNNSVTRKCSQYLLQCSVYSSMLQLNQPLTVAKDTSSNLSLNEDSEGRKYFKRTTCSCRNEEISLLTSLKHPNLVRYYHTDEQETNKIIFDYCQFGLLPDLDLSKQELDAHDLWSMRNQILHALKYLASQGLYHKGLNVSNVLVCSLYPIKVKLSLFSAQRVLIRSVNTDIPIQEFWKQKMNEQEEVCVDNLIRSIVKSVFLYSILEKNIFFTNPSTLERNDLESLKALICSIESETMFKSGQCIGDFSSVNNNLSCVFKSFKSQEQKNLFFSQTLLLHVFTQAILKCKKPLLEFNIDRCLVQSRNKEFSIFATKFISISVNFRNVFFRAFDFTCGSKGNHLALLTSHFNFDPFIISSCTTVSHLSSPSVVYLNLLNKFPITSITTDTLNFDTRLFDKEKVTELKLSEFQQDLATVTLFPNLYSFGLFSSRAVHDFSVLACCPNLRSVTLYWCTISDFNQFHNIEQLTSFSLFQAKVSDFSPLSELTQLKKLSMFNCNFTDFNILSPLQNLEDLDLSGNKITDISALSLLNNLRILSLASTINRLDYSPISCLQSLEKLELDNNKITDISFLSSLKNLVDLSLKDNKIIDLTPLSSLFMLQNLSLRDSTVFCLRPLTTLTQLSYLDVRGTLLPTEHQKQLTNSYDIKTLINSLEHGVDLNFGNFYCRIVDLSLLSQCTGIKSLILTDKCVEDISEISKFTNLETLDLSNVRLPNRNKLTDISFLSSCLKLKSLFLDESDVTHLSPLSSMTDLLRLRLCNTQVHDLSPLKELSKLSFLDVRETFIPQSLQELVNNCQQVKELIRNFL